MIALIDMGNARVKWASLVGGRLASFGQAVLGDNPAEAVDDLLGAVGDAKRVLVSNVAGAAVGRLLIQGFGDRHGVAVEFARTAARAGGVTCGYRDPARLGVDRWLAVLAAHRSGLGTACVVDAGTALTVDVVDADGIHHGGLILPGLRTMADSLQQRTSDVGPTDGDSGAPAGLALFGRSTEEAVTRAALLAGAAMVDRCVRRVAEHQGRSPALLITGGDGQALMGWLESVGQFDAHLVLRGLACIARADHPESG